MSKAVKVFIIYIIFLLACSFIFNLFKIGSDFHNIPNSLYQVRPIIIPTIIGGIIALKYIMPARLVNIFMIIYFSLWILRYLVLFLAHIIGEVNFFGRVIHFDLIIANYYRTASRLETPLPFILFWLIYYIYSVADQSGKKTKEFQK